MATPLAPVTNIHLYNDTGTELQLCTPHFRELETSITPDIQQLTLSSFFQQQFHSFFPTEENTSTRVRIHLTQNTLRVIRLDEMHQPSGDLIEITIPSPTDYRSNEEILRKTNDIYHRCQAEHPPVPVSSPTHSPAISDLRRTPSPTDSISSLSSDSLSSSHPSSPVQEIEAEIQLLAKQLIASSPVALPEITSRLNAIAEQLGINISSTDPLVLLTAIESTLALESSKMEIVSSPPPERPDLEETIQQQQVHIAALEEELSAAYTGHYRHASALHSRQATQEKHHTALQNQLEQAQAELISQAAQNGVNQQESLTQHIGSQFDLFLEQQKTKELQVQAGSHIALNQQLTHELEETKERLGACIDQLQRLEQTEAAHKSHTAELEAHIAHLIEKDVLTQFHLTLQEHPSEIDDEKKARLEQIQKDLGTWQQSLQPIKSGLNQTQSNLHQITQGVLDLLRQAIEEYSPETDSSRIAAHYPGTSTPHPVEIFFPPNDEELKLLEQIELLGNAALPAPDNSDSLRILQNSLESMAAEKESLEKSLATAQKNLQKGESQRKELQERLEHASAIQEVKQTQKESSALLRARQKQGETAKELRFSTTSLAKAYEENKRLEITSKQQQIKIAELKAHLETLRQTQAQADRQSLEARKKENNRLQEQIRSQKRQIVHAAQETTLQELQKIYDREEIARKQQYIQELQQELQRTQEQLRVLSEETLQAIAALEILGE